MDRYFLFALFLYLLSVLLALAENRTDLKAAGLASRVSYWLGSALTAAILVSRFAGRGEAGVGDFFAGTLIALTILAVVCAIGRFFSATAWAPTALAAVSLILGSMAQFRARVTADPSQATALTGAHVTCMFIALAALTLSFIFSSLFLIQDHLLKRRAMGRLVSALPPLELTSRLNFASITVGTAALAMGVLGGARALRHAPQPKEILLDPSIALSALMLFLYIALITIRIGALERARTVSVVSIIFYWLMMFVFLGAHANA